jgi:hypothetical protein
MRKKEENIAMDNIYFTNVKAEKKLNPFPAKIFFLTVIKISPAVWK